MCTENTEHAIKYAVLVSVRLHGYRSIVYWSLCLSFGAATLAEAREKGGAAVHELEDARQQAHGFVVKRICTHCSVTGIEPGTDEQLCTQCEATGTVPLTLAEMAELYPELGVLYENKALTA